MFRDYGCRASFRGLLLFASLGVWTTAAALRPALVKLKRRRLPASSLEAERLAGRGYCSQQLLLLSGVSTAAAAASVSPDSRDSRKDTRSPSAATVPLGLGVVAAAGEERADAETG